MAQQAATCLCSAMINQAAGTLHKATSHFCMFRICPLSDRLSASAEGTMVLINQHGLLRKPAKDLPHLRWKLHSPRHPLLTHHRRRRRLMKMRSQSHSCGPLVYRLWPFPPFYQPLELRLSCPWAKLPAAESNNVSAIGGAFSIEQLVCLQLDHLLIQMSLHMKILW